MGANLRELLILPISSILLNKSIDCNCIDWGELLTSFLFFYFNYSDYLSYSYFFISLISFILYNPCEIQYKAGYL